MALVMAALLWPQAARAQVASPRCPAPFALSIPNAGSGTVNANACHEGFGIGFLMVAPSHGTVTIDTLASTVTYAHNGNSALSDTFRFDDGSGFYVQVNVTIGPASAITIAPASLPTISAGTPFSQTLSASGGTGPYTYTLDSGTLPTGLTLSGAGVLSGTPTQRGPFAFSVRATDATSAFGVRSYTPTVAGGTLSLTPNPPPNAVVSAPYSVTFTPSGGVAPMSLIWEPNPSFPLPPGLSLAGNTLSGTPTAAGSYTFGIRITDSSTGPGSWFQVINVTMTVTPPPTIVVAPATVPGATVGAPYSQSLSASGGTSPYSFAVTAGALPAGLTLSTAGALTGTPTAGGTFNFTATATDNNGFSGSRAYTMVVAAPTITIAPATLPGGSLGTAYSQTVTPAGGTAPYSIALTAGALPAGLSLSGAGLLSGTPTASGTFNFTVTATDSSTGTGAPYTGSRAYSLTIAAPVINVSPLTLPSGSVAAAYNQNLTASGGTAPYGFAVTAGALPAGLSLSTTGVLGGTPTAGGTFNFTITATDANGAPGSRAYSVVIAAPTISVAPTTLPSGTTGAAYSQSITASGGTAPYGYAVTAGALPAGLTLSAAGVLSGMPSAGGAFNFTVTATDSSTGTGPYAGARAYSLTIAAAVISVSPGTLPAGTISTAYSQTLSASGGTAPYTYSITAGVLPTGVTLSAAGVLSGTPTAAGTYNFTVGATDSSTGTGPFSGSQAYSVAIADVVPVANAGSATVAYGSGANPITLNITGGVPTTVAVATAAANGTAAASGTSITYQPSAGFAGTDTFAYTASNTAGTSAPATITITVTAPMITISASAPLDAMVGAAYTQTFTFAGGASPYTGLAVTGLPAGLSVTVTDAQSITVSGTPLEAGTFTLGVSGTDDSTGDGPFTASQNFTLNALSPTLALTPASGTLPGTANAVFSQSITATGGSAPYTYLVSAGVLPAGLSLDPATGLLSGTPSLGGSYPVSVTATDSSTGAGAPFSVTGNYTLQIANAIVLSPTTLPDGTTTVAYNQGITATGGTVPYAFAIDSGTLPPGLVLTSGGTLSGMPTSAGSYTFQASATDFNGRVGTRSYTLQIIEAPTIVLSPTTLPDGVAGVAYSQSITASGGTGPYAFSLVSGALPAGMSFTSAGVLSGTSVGAGTFNFTVRGVDANGFSADLAYALVIASPTIVIAPATLPDGVAAVAYSQTITASGGTGPYSFSLLTGALPAGMSFTSAGLLSGTPSAAGAFNFTVRAADTNGFSADQAYALVIAAPTIVIAPASLPDGDVGVAYSQTLTASGGTGPYGFALVSGALPAGMGFTSAGLLSGTPVSGGTFNFTVRATDALGFSVEQAHALVIVAPAIVIAPASLPDAVAGVAYSQSLIATGGTAPYAFSPVAGALPAGLTLSGAGVLSGTPDEANTFTFTVRATDDNGATGERAYTLVIAAPAIVLTPTTLPVATAGSAYSASLGASGGTTPYAFSLVSGSLPTGLTLSSAGVLAGTPTADGAFNFTVRATDALGFTGDRAYAITVGAPVLAITPDTLPDALAGTAYSQSLAGTGGVAPYGFSRVSGELPSGLSLTSSGDIAGIPLAGGTFAFTVRVADANGFTADQAFSLFVETPVVTITPDVMSDGGVGLAYSQLLSAGGGIAPYTFAVSVGALPGGLTLSSDGTLSGNPTAAGTFNLTIRATDLNGFHGDQAYALTIAPPPTITLTTGTLVDGVVGSGYTQALTATGGTSPYTFAVTAGVLPTGISLAASGNLAGTPSLAGSFTFDVTVTDSLGFAGVRSYTLVVANAPPVAVDDAVSTNAGTPVAIAVTANDTGAISSIALASAPANGMAVVAGLEIQYTPASGFAGSDSFSYTATGPGGTSSVATVSVEVIPLPVPAGVPQTVTTLAGQPVSFDAGTGATGGPFTGVTLLSTPSQGVVEVAGTTVTYTPAADASGSVTIGYTLNNAFGPSAVITSTVIINPRPVAIAHGATTLAGIAVDVNLTEGASGGPFIAADVVSVSPAAAGTTQVTAAGATDDRQYVLTFTPSADYVGTAQVSYTLGNAFATSDPAVVTIEVMARPDPTQDAEVQGLLVAQSAAAKRFAHGQIDNFQSRMERLHHAGAGQGFDNGLTVAITRRCMDGRAQRPGERCADEPLATSASSSAAAAPGDTSSGADSNAPIGIWTAGGMAFGDYDLRGAGNGFEFETSAISAGVDYRFSPGLVLGGGVGYGRDVTDVGDNGTRSEASARSLALYGSHRPADNFFVDLLLGYQSLSFESRRHVTATGGMVTGDRDGDQWFGSLSTTYEQREESYTLAPYLRLDVARGELDAFTEQGDPIHALHYSQQDVDSTTGNLGLRVEFHRRTGWGLFSPLLRLEYQHDFEDPGTATLTYADLLGGPFYRTRLTELDSSRFLLGLGAILQTERDWLFKAEYRGLFGNDDQDEHSIMLNVEKQF